MKYLIFSIIALVFVFHEVYAVNTCYSCSGDCAKPVVKLCDETPAENRTQHYLCQSTTNVDGTQEKDCVVNTIPNIKTCQTVHIATPGASCSVCDRHLCNSKSSASALLFSWAILIVGYFAATVVN